MDPATTEEVQTTKSKHAALQIAHAPPAISEDMKARLKNTRGIYTGIIQLLQAVLGLPRFSSSSDTSRPPDPVFHEYGKIGALIVCIEIDERAKLTPSTDSELKPSIENSKVGMSISILDTRRLNPQQVRYAFCTRDFCVVSPAPRHMDRFENSHLFRKRTLLTLDEVVPTIERLIDRTRKIILVGDRIERDVERLRQLGLDLRTSVIGCLNTSRLSLSVSGHENLYQWDLKTTLRRIQFCPSSAPGTTIINGHDTDFILRCVILFATECYDGNVDGQDVVASHKLDMLSTLSCTLEIKLRITGEEKESLQQARRQLLDKVFLSEEIGGSLRRLRI